MRRVTRVGDRYLIAVFGELWASDDGGATWFMLR